VSPEHQVEDNMDLQKEMNAAATKLTDLGKKKSSLNKSRVIEDPIELEMKKLVDE